MAETFAINDRYREGVLQLINQFSEFGATPEGGVDRLAASEEDKLARDYLCRWFDEKGFVTLVDPVGNVFGVLELDSSQNDTSFFCGSHLDSQPHGGRFDGTLGVAFACMAALAIKGLIDRGDLTSTFRNFVVACWTSEEGARFQPSLLGSRTFVGQMSVEDAWNCRDEDGVSLKQTLSEIGYVGENVSLKPDHYLEVHIEQGTKLENAGAPIGIVTSAWGGRKLSISVTGKADHTGPTPMEDRKDALLAAAKLIQEVNEIAKAANDPLHTSVGRIEVVPNSPNTVAENAVIWVELRGTSDSMLDRAEQSLASALSEIASETGCLIEIKNREVRDVVLFDASSNSQIATALDREEISHIDMTTIAGHDALQLQSICSSSLLFVPSKDGISHSPDEFTSDDDIERGFNATMVAISELVAQSVLSPTGEGCSCLKQ